jgi:hypothetical protein
MAFNGFYCCPQCKPSVVEKISRGEPVGTLWRHGNKLVALVNTPLLDRCVKCNASSEGYRLRRKLLWHHPAIYLLIFTPFVGILGYAIVAMIVRKRSKTHVGLCPAHRSKRINWLLGSWIAFFAAIAGLIVSGVNVDSKVAPAGMIASGVVVLASIITLVVVSRTVLPTRITRTHVFLKGVHPDYLDSLPVWSEGGLGV